MWQSWRHSFFSFSNVILGTSLYCLYKKLNSYSASIYLKKLNSYPSNSKVDSLKQTYHYRDQTWFSKVPREVFALGFQYLPGDPVNVNEWQNHVWSLLLHKFKENAQKKNWKNVCALYSSALPPFSNAHTLFINILDSGRGQVLFLMMIWRLSTRFAWRTGECINIIQ